MIPRVRSPARTEPIGLMQHLIRRNGDLRWIVPRDIPPRLGAYIPRAQQIDRPVPFTKDDAMVDIPWSGASTAFQQYFAGSDIGGIFSIDAIFPINGDSTQVTSAVALLTNSDGTTQTLLIQF